MKPAEPNQLFFGILTAAFVAAVTLALPARGADGCVPAPAAPCPRPVEYWKHAVKSPNTCPVQSLRVGNELYSRVELAALLHLKDRDDMSVALAQELIAAKLNRFMGCDITHIKSTMIHANGLLQRPGRLPYKVALPRPAAIEMVKDTAALELFNKRRLSPGCAK